MLFKVYPLLKPGETAPD